MSAPYNLNIDLQVGRGHGLHLRMNGRPVPDSYGAIVMAELAQLCAGRGASPRQDAASSG